MTNVIQFPSKKSSSALQKRTGMVDYYPAYRGMVLFDGCVPVSIEAELLALMERAGVKIRYNGKTTANG
jgi:hypothetical protein